MRTPPRDTLAGLDIPVAINILRMNTAAVAAMLGGPA
jgi:hypothetical protein